MAGHDDRAADALLNRIQAKLDMLADSPGVGRDRAELGRNLRSFVVRKYLIFYQPIDDGILLVRVIYGARDLRAIDFT